MQKIIGLIIIFLLLCTIICFVKKKRKRTQRQVCRRAFSNFKWEKKAQFVHQMCFRRTSRVTYGVSSVETRCIKLMTWAKDYEELKVKETDKYHRGIYQNRFSDLCLIAYNRCVVDVNFTDQFCGRIRKQINSLTISWFSIEPIAIFQL